MCPKTGDTRWIACCGPRRGCPGRNGLAAGSSSIPVMATGSASSARNGFVIEALHELYAPEDAKDPAYYDIATAQWARRWPVEDLWTAQLIG